MRLTPRHVLLSAVLALTALAQEDETLDVFQPTVTLNGDAFALITEAPAPPNLDLFRQKRDDSSLIGWFSQSGYWYSLTCPPGEYYAADPTWGACCSSASSQCYYATGCVGTSVIFVGGRTGDCAGTGLCDTFTIFNSQDVAATGIRSIIQCLGTSGFHDAPRTLYRGTFPLTTIVPTPTVTKTATETATATVAHVVTETPNAASRTARGDEGVFFVYLVSLIVTALGAWLL